MSASAMNYHELQITNLATLHSWTIRPYCESVEEAVRLARLTFPAARFEVKPVASPSPVSPAPANPKQVELF